MSSQVRLAWVGQGVLDFMIAGAAAALPLETGGVLLGYWVVPTQELVVAHAVGPGPRAVHKPDGFVPDPELHEEEIARIYEESRRLLTYLGDWHTHPRPSLALSRRDRRTLRSISNYQPARAATPILAILSFPPSWNLKIWRLLQSKLLNWIAL